MNLRFRTSASSLGFVALIVLGLGTSPSLATNWVKCATAENKTTWYYDADSVRTDKGPLYVWLKMTLPGPEYKDFLRGYAASLLTYAAVDCSSRTSATVENDWYDQQGNLLRSFPESNLVFRPATPDSVFSPVISAVCGFGASLSRTSAASTPPLAGNWVECGKGGGNDTWYYDADSLRTDKNLLYVWFKVQPRDTKGRVLFYDAVDCSSRLEVGLATDWYDLQGDFVPKWSGPNSSLVVESLDPGTPLGQAANTVCSLGSGKKGAPRAKGGRTEAENASTVGSGFVVSADGLVLTNAHVVPSCEAIRVTTSSGERRTASLAASDPQTDLALLKTKIGFSSVAGFRSGQSARLGEDVIALGYPLHGLLASGVNVSSGTVSALAGIANDSTKLQISAPVQPGNSGGPLLDLSGAVVGIVVAKLDAIKMAAAIGDIPQNVNFAIKADVARLFLEGQGVSLQPAPPTAPRKKEDVAAMGRDFTVLVECLNGPDAN